MRLDLTSNMQTDNKQEEMGSTFRKDMREFLKSEEYQKPSLKLDTKRSSNENSA